MYVCTSACEIHMNILSPASGGWFRRHTVTMLVLLDPPHRHRPCAPGPTPRHPGRAGLRVGPKPTKPPPNTCLPPSLLTQGRIGLFWTIVNYPIQCVPTGAGSPLRPHLNITFTYKLELVTFRLVIR